VRSAEPIVRASGEDAPAVTTVIARAFHPLPPGRWLVPDPAERARLLPAYFAILVEHAIRHGEVDIAAGGHAVAVWFPPSDEPPADPDDYDARVSALVGPHLDRFRLFDETLAKVHPHEPHWYLLFLAVAPEYQGHGLGTALLRHRLAAIDADGQAAYLEAADERSRPLYEREGFTAHQEPFRLPDGPQMFPMWRQPR
jgi:ribosomal protein S18 acetylase RimI-like enzyme